MDSKTHLAAGDQLEGADLTMRLLASPPRHRFPVAKRRPGTMVWMKSLSGMSRSSTT